MTKGQTTALQLLSRFRLADIAILISLVVFLCSPRPDTQARADIQINNQRLDTHKELIDKLDKTKEDEKMSNVRYEELIKRLDHMQKSIDDLTEREITKR